MRIKGTIHCYYTDENGERLFEQTKHNAITLAGFDFVRKAISDSSDERPAAMKYIAVGSGSTATSTAMTALENEHGRRSGTWAYDDDKKSFTITATFPVGSINGSAIQEVGVLNSESDGVLLDRGVFESAIPVLANLEFTSEVTFELA